MGWNRGILCLRWKTAEPGEKRKKERKKRQSWQYVWSCERRRWAGWSRGGTSEALEPIWGPCDAKPVLSNRQFPWQRGAAKVPCWQMTAPLSSALAWRCVYVCVCVCVCVSVYVCLCILFGKSPSLPWAWGEEGVKGQRQKDRERERKSIVLRMQTCIQYSYRHTRTHTHTCSHTHTHTHTVVVILSDIPFQAPE